MSSRSDNTSSFDTLYLRLSGLAEGQTSKIVGITSPGRGEGVTTVVVGLARAAVKAGAGPVLVIDVAPHGRRVAGVARVKPAPVISVEDLGTDVDGGLDAHIASSRRFGIDVLTVDSPLAASPGPAPWQSALRTLRERYPFTVVDSADLRSPVPRAWRNRVDELMLVLDTTRTTVERLVRLQKELQGADLEIDGFALNKRSFHVPKFFYRFI
jgi:Mrp family chromosome partitioning ATPase